MAKRRKNKLTILYHIDVFGDTNVQFVAQGPLSILGIERCILLTRDKWAELGNPTFIKVTIKPHNGTGASTRG